MKKILSLIMTLALILNISNVSLAENTEDREAAKNKAKEKVEINTAGLITGNEKEYISLLSELIDAPGPEEGLSVLKKAGMDGVHPRIIATKSDFENIKQLTKTDEFISLLYIKQDEYTNALITNPVIDLRAENNDKLSYAREVMDRMLLLGMMYQMTGDVKYYEYAQSQAEIAMKESVNWMNDVLQTAEMVAGLSICYDWFFDCLASNFKITLKNYIVTKMRAISTNYSPVPQGFARQVNNWNAVCNGAYGIAALSIMDEEPELAGMILSGAVNSIALSIDQFGPDGAFPEGPGYWAYQVQYIVYLISALDSAIKTDFGLSELEGLKRTALYSLYMHGPTYSAFNYSDSGSGIPQTQYLFWFAKKYNYSGLTNYAKTINPSGTNFQSWEFKSTDTFIMLWYQPTEKNPYEDLNEGGVFHGSNPVASLRNRWDDSNATYVAFKGGMGSLPHGNLDIGSFVIDSMGTRWVEDLGRENDYWLPGYFDYESGGRWTFYVNRAEGHNTVVINPSKAADQNPDAKCEITEFKSSAGNGYGIVDMTEAYSEYADKALRGIALCGDSVLVKDELELKSKSDVLWGISTKTEIKLSEDKKSAILCNGQKRMKVDLISPSEAVFDSVPAESLSLKAIPGTKSLSSYKRLITRGIYSGKVDIVVQFTSFLEDESEPEVFKNVFSLDSWKNSTIYETSGIIKEIKLNGKMMDEFSSSKLGYTVYLDENDKIPFVEANYDRVNTFITVNQAEKIGDAAKITAISKDPRIGKMEYTFKFKEKRNFGKPKNLKKISVLNASASTDKPELAIDSRLDTCWACEGEQYILLDIGEKQPVDIVSIAFRSGLERIAYFDIEVSDDGKNFTQVFSGEASGASNDYENFRLKDVNTRFVKIICKGSSTSAWASINEVALFN